MPKRMLIDASHPEETRVVVLDGQKVEEFDFEAASKRPLKGNIYLAKVTRVEPSLQAAFVEYGGNRQGFLAFSEIHPDYYQIPVADRMVLLAEQEAEARRHSDDEFESFDTVSAPAQSSVVDDDDAPPQNESDDDAGEYESASSAEANEASDFVRPANLSAADASTQRAPDTVDSDDRFADSEISSEIGHAGGAESEQHNDEPREASQQLQSAQRPTQRWVRRRHYKIQEVIKRRQVILVQVVKEERGNKGAALTTYLSLAGRYCVLMPNTPRGGGISRKITNATDRKRLKSAAQALELPEGMGLIIRTAGENRTKVEIKRDYEYLLRMWDTIRELTLKSNAPACVYEEGDLIKRAIRDLYNKDVSEVVVEGEDGYRNAKDFMRMLMPSHAKNVKQYKETIPLFQRLHIEAQLDAMFSPTVTLKSGGYIVINQTEALVAVDVNSGRATREHSIEDTAYKTNLEAAEEVARQLRLRDLAGLIVIDFIDMEDARNDRSVEKRLRDCVKNDRARVQIGKISQFGLLEMSRQRLRAGVVAGSTIPCPACGGQGIVRSVESTALRVLRALDEEGQRQRASALTVHLPVDVAIYALNQKRREIARMEQEYGITVAFQPMNEMLAGTFEMERIGQRAPDERPRPVPQSGDPLPVVLTELSDGVEQVEESIVDEVEESDMPVAPADIDTGRSDSEPGVRRRRRRRRRGRDRGPAPHSGTLQHPLAPESATSAGELSTSAEGQADDDGSEDEVTPLPPGSHQNEVTSTTTDEGTARRKRRRRRRGRRSQREDMPVTANVEGSAIPTHASAGTGDEELGTEHADLSIAAPHEAATLPNAPSEPVWSLSPEPTHDETPSFAEPAKVAARPHSVADEIAADHKLDASAAIDVEQSPAVPIGTAQDADSEPHETASQEPRKGWWQRPFRLRD
jgi:ribonuclease E